MQKCELLVTVKDPNFLPLYASDLASGADVRAYIDEELTLLPGERLLVPTGLCFAIPEGYEMQVRPRSGLALKLGVTILNAPGTIDADYRGELKLLVINHGKETVAITPGMRLAQIVVAPVVQANFVVVETLEATARGEGGFGHTGTH
jgi:dUTP pyrophosphatase